MNASHFYIPKTSEGATATYLCGHSLGPMPKNTEHYIEEELKKWANLGVNAHFTEPKPWVDFHTLATPHLQKLCGAKSHEVVAMGSLTQNLHLLLASFYKPDKQKRKILIEPNAFSSDIFALESHLEWHGLDPKKNIIVIDTQNKNGLISIEDIERIFKTENNTIALCLISGINYKTGQGLDLANVSQIVKKNQAILGLDLAHAIGNIPLKLNEWNIDFGVWCSYKYLNSGPGSIGGIFVHEKHGLNPKTFKLKGWWGTKKENRFDMNSSFEGIVGAEGWQLSNVPIFSLSMHLASLEIFEKFDYLDKLYPITLHFQSILRDELESTIFKNKIKIITPHQNQGAMMCIEIPNKDVTWIVNQLRQIGIICDARKPAIIRVSFVPLFNTEDDIDVFVKALYKVITH